jgi:hypothetical protein
VSSWRTPAFGGVVFAVPARWLCAGAQGRTDEGYVIHGPEVAACLAGGLHLTIESIRVGRAPLPEPSSLKKHAPHFNACA